MGNCMVPASAATVCRDEKCKNAVVRSAQVGNLRSADVGNLGLRDQGSSPGSGKGCGGGAVRVKVVITKQELAKLLSNGLAMEDLLVELQARGVQKYQQEQEKGWRPALESIPEDAGQCF